MMQWALSLPAPPSDNDLHASTWVGGHRRYSTKVYKMWKNEAGRDLLMAKIPRKHSPKAIWGFSGGLYVNKGRHFKVDLTNFKKAFYDLIKMHINVDDSRLFYDGLSHKILLESQDKKCFRIAGMLLIWENLEDYLADTQEIYGYIPARFVHPLSTNPQRPANQRGLPF